MLAFLSFMITAFFKGLAMEKVDVVIGTSPPMFQAVSAWLIAAVRRRPFILEVRDLWPEFALDLGVLRNRILIWLARRLELFLYSRASEIIVNSRSYQEYLLTRGVPKTLISVVPNGVDTSMYCQEHTGEAFRRDHGMQDKFVVMYAGALGLANDMDCLLKAAAHLRDRSAIVFAIVGAGKELPRWRTQADSLQLNNVRFIPAQPKQCMPSVLAAADVCVAMLKDVPVLRTTYPNKVFDYMAAARTTVLAIDGPIREVIEKSQSGICIAPGDSAALTEALLELYKSPELREEMGRNARSFVISHFDRALQAKQLADILQNHIVDMRSSNRRADAAVSGL